MLRSKILNDQSFKFKSSLISQKNKNHPFCHLFHFVASFFVRIQDVALSHHAGHIEIKQLKTPQTPLRYLFLNMLYTLIINMLYIMLYQRTELYRIAHLPLR